MYMCTWFPLSSAENMIFEEPSISLRGGGSAEQTVVFARCGLARFSWVNWDVCWIIQEKCQTLHASFLDRFRHSIE
jgi:hypothetical protein